MSSAVSDGDAAAASTDQVGSYVLVRRLGRGSMAEVWLGRHVVSGGIAAVKRQLPGGHADALANEARIVARLRHPHVVPLFEFGPGFVVMPYIEGVTLARRMATPIAPASAVRIARQIASALAHAHECGIIHRDVKPSNILLDRQETAFLADFGIAAASATTRTSGTVRYMAPEQVRGAPACAAADQYALAFTLLEVLSGGAIGVDLGAAIADVATAVSPVLAAALGRALATDPDDRFPDVLAFATALAAVDLATAAPWQRLAEPTRARGRHTWLAAAEREAITAADLCRADYRLTTLAAAGHVDADAVASLLNEAGVVDVGFSVHLATTRLGTLSDPDALARVREVIILVHGWSSTRATWRVLAPALARDNGEALVIVPDLYGFGASRFSAAPNPSQAAPRALVDTALALLGILGLGDLPTVMVAHSTGGMAALTLDDARLPPTLARLALTPLLAAYDSRLRWAFRIGAIMVTTLGRIRWLRRALARRLGRVPAMLQLEVGDNDEVIDNQLALPAGHAARQLAAMSRVKMTVGRQRRLVLVTGKDDPVTSRPKVVSAAIAGLGLDPAQVHVLASGGHTPQLPLALHPEWTARNIDELCHLVQSLLVTAHQPTATPVAATATR
jgi:hypothetical protein